MLSQTEYTGVSALTVCSNLPVKKAIEKRATVCGSLQSLVNDLWQTAFPIYSVFYECMTYHAMIQLIMATWGPISCVHTCVDHSLPLLHDIQHITQRTVCAILLGIEFVRSVNIFGVDQGLVSDCVGLLFVAFIEICKLFLIKNTSVVIWSVVTKKTSTHPFILAARRLQLVYYRREQT